MYSACQDVDMHRNFLLKKSFLTSDWKISINSLRNLITELQAILILKTLIRNTE